VKNEKLTIALTTIFNIVILVVIVLVLNVATTHFEKVTLSLLIFIAVNINALTQVIVRTIESNTAGLHADILSIRRERSNWKTNKDEEYAKSLMTKLEESQMRFNINTGFNILYLLVAAFTLLTNL